MSWLDALLGNLQSSGTAVDAEGSINFTDGLEVTPNPGQHRNDVRPNATLRAMASRVVDPRLVGVGICTGATGALTVATTPLLAEGAFASVLTDAMLTVATGSAAVTYTGADSVRALVWVSAGLQGDGQEETLVSVVPYLEGAPLSAGAAFFKNFHVPVSFCFGTTLTPNDVLDLRIVTDNDESPSSLTLANVQMIVVLIGAI